MVKKNSVSSNQLRRAHKANSPPRQMIVFRRPDDTIRRFPSVSIVLCNMSMHGMNINCPPAQQANLIHKHKILIAFDSGQIGPGMA